jgi:hypothetical protein
MPSNHLHCHLHSLPAELARRWTWSRLAAVTAAVIAFASGCSPASTTGFFGEASPVPATGQVTIDPSRTYQVMQRFGIGLRVWDDPHQFNFPQSTIPQAGRTEILRQVYTDLGLTRVRPAIEALGIEVVNDNTDPFTFNWARFNFAGKRNDAHVDFVKEAIPFGLKTYFPVILNLPLWITEANPDEYVELALAILIR